MRKNKRRNSILVLVIILLCITMGYAFLTANIKFNGFSKINNKNWDIHFENIVFNDNNVELSEEDSEAEIDSTTRTSVNYTITLNQPGDFYEFNVDVVNAGAIDGMIESITSKLNGEVIDELPIYLLYSVTYSDDVELAPKQILRAGETETYKVRVEFKKDIEADELEENTQSLEFEFEVVYVQADNSAIDIDRTYLYNVLEKAAQEGTYAKEYTGAHQDSFTQPATHKIYHWYGSNDTNGTAILDKNNVIFAGQCWQMLRTTDTGGVKMIYNGEAENNQCLNTRGTHVGYGGNRTSQNLASNYWYGTDYTYDSTNKVFRVSGTTEQATWNATTGPGLVGKYTCKLTSEDGSCSTLYLVESYYNTTSAYVIPLNSNSNYSQFGTLQFNASYNSPTYVGYMYGDVYPYSTLASTSSQSFSSSYTILSSTSFADTYQYSKTISYTGSSYSLVDPILGSAIPEDSYEGYYTYRSATTTSGAQPYYIVGRNGTGTNYYYVRLSGTKQLTDFNMMIGDSLTDNGDGTYTVNNASAVTPMDWYSNYASYKEQYTCGDATTTTCASPRYLSNTTITNYTYVNAGEKVTISKTRNGLELTDTMIISIDKLIKNYSTYSDYKYTCGDTSTTCTESTLRMITAYNAIGYTYAPNHYYGSSVTWDGTNYTLVDPIEIENYNNMNNISTHHYMCVSNGLKTCSTVAYIYYYTGSSYYYYITLSNGVQSVEKAMEDMFTKNTTNSTIKSGVDAWYKHYLLEDYDDYIEDTIFCNDRSIRALNGWNPNGGMTNDYLQFKEYNVTSDLSCTNTTDKFSVSNSNAQLTYKVGLMTSPEMNLLTNNNARKTWQWYWLASPYYFSDYNAGERNMYSGGSIDGLNVPSPRGVRPAVSLSPGVKYVDGGDGSMANPYVVKMK